MKQAAKRILTLTLVFSIMVPGFLFSYSYLNKFKVQPAPQQPAPAPEPEPQIISTKQIPIQIVYQLLAAELASDRNYPEIALANYIAAARQTQDASIAHHAAEIAISLGTLEDAVEPITLWAETDKYNSEAQITAAALYLRLNQVANAIVYLKRVEQLDKASADDYFLALYQELPDKNDSANLIEALKALANQAQSNSASLALERIFKSKN